MKLPDAKYDILPRLDIEEFIEPETDVGPDEIEDTLESPQAHAAFRRIGAYEFCLMPALIRCLCQEMIEDVDEAYLTGAVADPTCKARHIGCDNDKAIKGSDDFDIAILVEGWNLPLVSSALSQHLFPEILSPIAGIFGPPKFAWENTHWDCGPKEAWGKLPGPACEALLRGMKHVIWCDKGTERWATCGQPDLFFAERERFFAANDADRRVRIYPTIGGGE